MVLKFAPIVYATDTPFEGPVIQNSSSLKMEFQNFLTAKLKEKKIDVGVYSSYLMGILEDSLEEDEKREMVLDILASLVVSCNCGTKSPIQRAGF